MRIPFVTSWIRERARARLRQMMRGYRSLRARGQLGRIAAVHSALTEMALEIEGRHFSRSVLGAAADHAELATRQYLLARIGGVSLSRPLMYALGVAGGQVVHPLPAQWRRALREQGFDVAGLRSALLWTGCVLVFFGYGVGSVVATVLASLRATFGAAPAKLGRYAHFEGVTAGNLPRPCKDGRSHDIVSWYAQWNQRAMGLAALTHTVPGTSTATLAGLPLVRIDSPYPRLASLSATLALAGWGIGAIARAAVELLVGRWWHAMLLKEATRATVVRLQEPNRLAVDYLFNNSNWIYRPLWTYEAERSGSRMLLYFYSTNTEAFKDSNGYPEITYGYRAMSWSHYLVWDDYQADFIRRAAGSAPTVSVVGPIWFHSSAEEMAEVSANAVAVFDVQPHRDSRYRVLGMPSEYYVPRVACQFLQDIHTVLRECGSEMVLKRKRQIGRLLHPAYRTVVEELSRSEGFIAIDPETNALRVIERCAAVISMPFTSTALLGRHLGKPSIYYDPAGLIQKDDRAAHGIPVVRGIGELRAWLNQVLNSVERSRVSPSAHASGRGG